MVMAVRVHYAWGKQGKPTTVVGQEEDVPFASNGVPLGVLEDGGDIRHSLGMPRHAFGQPPFVQASLVARDADGVWEMYSAGEAEAACWTMKVLRDRRRRVKDQGGGSPSWDAAPLAKDACQHRNFVAAQMVQMAKEDSGMAAVTSEHVEGRRSAWYPR